MKHLYFIPLLTLVVIACNRSGDNNISLVYEDSLAQYRDTLMGKFDGIHVDTLIAEPFGERAKSLDPKDIYAGWYYNWRIFSKNGTVEELKIENSTTGIKFIEEGDVDGDGKDEWGFVTEWPTSNWMAYKLYHNNNGKWELLIDPTSIWLPHIDPEDKNYGANSAEELIQKSDKKGYLKVKFSDVRNDGGDFLLIDTLIQIPQRPEN